MSMAVSEEGDLITGEQVVDRLFVDPRLRRTALMCVLPAVRYRDEWCFRRNDLESWVAQQLALRTSQGS
jgi:hypothetical protein